MTNLTRCPQCGCVMPPDSPSGLCPSCLFRHGLGGAGVEQPLTEAAPERSFVPPRPQELTGYFPQFEIRELLGHGGMGAVYRARQISLDRDVALKIIKPDAASDVGFAERFSREARALAKLNHPCIVSVFDFGEYQSTSDGTSLYYLVMEYVDGTNLRHLIETQELSPGAAMGIIPQICEALQFAHDEGVIHRDIKPENILVDSKGRVKIADFGLAKLLGQSTEVGTLTGTHQVMGTPRYMAPEQMEGSREVDHRADIYSLGVVFYEMLTGELPLGSFEPPSRKVQVDVRLDEVVLRSLAKEPSRRYQHASELKTDVESLGEWSPSAQPPKPSKEVGESQPSELGRTALVWGIALTIPVFALIGFAVYWAESGWVLAALSFPWFCFAAAGYFCSETPRLKAAEKGINITAMIGFLITVAMIGFAISIEDSAWPLTSIPVLIAAAILGGLFGSLMVESEGQEADGAVPPVVDEDDDDDDDDEQEDEETEAQESLEWAAVGVGLVGGFRTWDLLKEGPDAVHQLLQDGTVGSINDLMVNATGPILLLAGIMMYSARFHVLGVVASALSMVSLNCFPVLIGLYSLSVLFSPIVRARFVDAALIARGSDRSQFDAKKPLPPGYGKAMGSTVTEIWQHWWLERDVLFTKFMQTLLAAAHLACLIAFMAFYGGSETVEDSRVITHQVGYPSPWFSSQVATGAAPSFNQSIHFPSTAWIFAGLGFAFSYMYWRIERVRNPAPRFWQRPEFMLFVWCGLGLIIAGVGTGVTLIAAKVGTDSPASSSSVETAEPRNSNPLAASTAERPEKEDQAAAEIALLIDAAANGQIGQLRRLVARNTDVNDKDAQGRTALMVAAENGHVSTVLTLIAMGANLNEKDQRGWSPLMFAVANRQYDVLVAVDRLQMVVEEVDDQELPREEAIRRFQEIPGISSQVLQEFSERLLVFNVDVNAADHQGETALMKAAAAGDRQSVNALIAGKSKAFHADPLRQDDQGYTALMHAVASGQTELVRAWIDETSPMATTEVIRLSNAAGQTPAQLAAALQHDELNKMLQTAE